MSTTRTTAVAVLALAGALASGVTTPARSSGADAQVAVDQVYPRPGDGRWTVHGHGYGHGRGMSQHGAQGAAQRGLDHERILSFYYPGTDLGRTRGRIKVLLTADSGSDVVVSARPGLRLKDLGTGTSHRLPTGDGATRWRLWVTPENRNAVSWSDGGAWQRWRPGGEDVLEGDGQFSAPGDPLTLHTPSGTATYRGAIRGATPSTGGTDRNTVNVLRLDSYVRGVVPAEMPASWEPEAVQAQTVAARTYGVHERRAHRALGWSYDICDTTSCQVYHGVAGEHPLADAAVEATSRQVLRYAGEPAFTQFSASSGGWTSAGSAPYLTAQADPYDDWSGNTVHDWSEPLTVRAVENAYPAIGRLRHIRVTQREGGGEWQGRVVALRLVGSRDTRQLSGDEFRFRFGLRSTWFSLSP